MIEAEIFNKVLKGRQKSQLEIVITGFRVEHLKKFFKKTQDFVRHVDAFRCDNKVSAKVNFLNKNLFLLSRDNAMIVLQGSLQELKTDVEVEAGKS